MIPVQERVRANPVNAALLDRLPDLALPQGHLTAGCLFQTLWNLRSGRRPDQGIKDYDVFYFDDRDLSWEAEDAVIRRVSAVTADLAVAVEVRNQARVHLWYEARFGAPYPQLRSAREGIDRYLVACTCLGIDLASGALHATHGLDDMEAGILRPNPLTPQPSLFRAKAESYRDRWPWLRIVDSATTVATVNGAGGASRGNQP
jgi:hypothetical protein